MKGIYQVFISAVLIAIAFVLPIEAKPKKEKIKKTELAEGLRDMQQQIASLELMLRTQQREIAQQQSKLEELDQAFMQIPERLEVRDEIPLLKDYLVIKTDVQGNPVIQIHDANFQIVNGSGISESHNGLGNLIVGYNEPSELMYSMLESDFEAAKALRHGSHNVVIGPQHAFVGTGGIVQGQNHMLLGDGSALIGGVSHSTVNKGEFVGEIKPPKNEEEEPQSFETYDDPSCLRD